MRKKTPYQKKTKAKSVVFPPAKEKGLFISLVVLSVLLLAASNSFAVTIKTVHLAGYQSEDIFQQKKKA